MRSSCARLIEYLQSNPGDLVTVGQVYNNEVVSDEGTPQKSCIQVLSDVETVVIMSSLSEAGYQNPKHEWLQSTPSIIFIHRIHILQALQIPFYLDVHIDVLPGTFLVQQSCGSHVLARFVE